MTVVTATANSNNPADVTCPTGQIATGGGGNAKGMDENQPILVNGKSRGWHVTSTTTSGNKTVWALCIPETG